MTLGHPLPRTLKVSPRSLSTGACPVQEAQLLRDHQAVREPKLAMQERGRQADRLQGGVRRTDTRREPHGGFQPSQQLTTSR